MNPIIYVGLHNQDKINYISTIRNSVPEKMFLDICLIVKTDPHDIKSKSRLRRLVEVRQIISILLYNNTSATLKQIGYILGDRDHSTIIYAIENAKSLLETDKRFKKRVVDIRDELKNVFKYKNIHITK